MENRNTTRITPDKPVVLRSRTLTNSAAEFVENRAGQAIIAGIIEVGDDCDVEQPEFDAQLDKFVPKTEVQDEAGYYKLSSDKITQFEATLKSFCGILKKRKLDAKLGITLKEPREYTMEDAFTIASKIFEEHNDLGTSTCMNVIRRCFRTAGNHEGALTNLLNLVPTDIYGSIIFGGFTIILAAVRNHENLLKDIQTSLAEIPQKLDTVHRLSLAYKHQSGSLRSWADKVFLSIFIVLERIVDRLSMKLGEKLLHKFKGRGDDIRDALDVLSSDIVGFQREIECCAQQRFGRIEENTIQGNKSISNLEAQVTDLKKVHQDNYQKIIENQQKYWNGAQQTMQQHLQAAVYNHCYKFITSSDKFDAVGGTIVIQEELEDGPKTLPSSPQTRDESRSDMTKFPAEKNRALLEKWQEDRASYNLDPSSSITDCLASVEDLSFTEKDKVKWLMDSDPMYEWLSTSQSCVLLIEAETPPESLINSISFTTSLLASSLSKTTDYTILSYLCGLGVEDHTDEESSGPLAIINILIGQLLKFIIDRRPSIDLLSLENEKFFHKSNKKFKYAVNLFCELLGMLEENEAIFILVDSFSRMPPGDDEATGDKLLGKIVDMITTYPALVIKILITDPLPCFPLKDRADFLLYLPDHVDGGKDGINIEILEQGNEMTIQRFKVENVRETSSSDDDSNDEW